MNQFNSDLESTKRNHLWLLEDGFYLNLSGLTEITDEIGQEFFGDYYYYNKNGTKYFIEEKWNQQKGDYIFIETWSCRLKNNVGWIYKQHSDIIYYRFNIVDVAVIKTNNLQNWWYNLYQNPIFLNEEQEQNIINKLSNIYSFNKTIQINRSEGFYIPVEEIIINKLGIIKRKKV